MTFAASVGCIDVVLNQKNCGYHSIRHQKAGKDYGTHVFRCLFADVLLTISAIVLASLILTSVLHLPPTAAYGFFAGAGLIVVADLVTMYLLYKNNKNEENNPTLEIPKK